MAKQKNFDEYLSRIKSEYKENPEVFSEFQRNFLGEYEIKDRKSAFEENPSDSSFMRYYRAVVDKKVSKVLKRNKGNVLNLMMFSLDYYTIQSEEQRKFFPQIAYELITHFEIKGIEKMFSKLKHDPSRLSLAKRVLSSAACHNISHVMNNGQVWLIGEKEWALKDYIKGYTQGGEPVPPCFYGM